MKKKLLKLCSTLLVLALLVNMLPMSIFAEELNHSLTADTEAVLQPEAAEPAQVVAELTNKRTQYTKEFLLSNGLHMATVYADPVHYEKDGQWAEIDNTLKLTQNGTVTNTAGVWNVSFPQQLSGGSVTIEKDGYTLSFALSGELRTGGELMTAAIGTETAEQLSLGQPQTATAAVQPKDPEAIRAGYQYAEAAPEKLYSQLRYSGVYQNTDIVYDLQANTVKESIVMASYSSTLRGYSYNLNVGQLVPVLEEGGQITFYAPDKKTVVMVMPAPYLLDAASEFNDDIQVRLTGKGSAYTLTYLLPTQWLAAPERAWPVILDPVVQADLDADNILDRTVAENRTHSYTWSILDAGRSAERGIIRSFLKYKELPAITSSDVVVFAQFTMYKVQNSSTTQAVELHKVTGSWDSQSVTWANQPAFSEKVEDYQNVKNQGNYYWTITDLVQDWYAGVNNGLAVKLSDAVENGTTDAFRQFYSADASSSYRPHLSVYFKNNNGVESYWNYITGTAGRAGTGSVNTYTGNLTWIRDDLSFGGNRMPVTIQHIYNANDVITPDDDTNANDSAGNGFGMGLGWRTNYNQLVYKWNQNSNYYVWEDGDGTDHYFEKVSGSTYKDEDGLELTLTVNSNSDTARYTITTKTGETSVFDKNGRLVKLVNNQDEPSEVNITYTSSTAKQIDTITDGAGRTYKFTYAAGQVQNLTYYGSAETFTEETKIARVKYWFDGWKLVSITEMDGSSSRYTYNAKGFLTSAKDIDGYQLSYTYNVPKDIQPYRVMSVSERDTVKNADGGTLTFEYGHNQTTLTDHNNNKEILHFNDQGNILSIQDDEGHAQFSQYAQISDADPTAKANQLRLSSKLQNTVSNLLSNSSFEGDTLWTLDGAGGTQEIDTAEKYLGTKSLLVRGGVYGPSFTVEAGATYTFSAYAKSAGDVGLIGIRKNGTIIRSTDIPICTDWVRYEVNFTNDESTEVQIQPVLSGQSQQGVYFDCVQLEKEPTASRYNLVDNGDFRYSGGWEPSSKCAPADARITVADIDPAASGLDNTCFKFTGDTANFKNIKQTVVVDGEEGDSFVLAGWAKGPAVPLSGDRKFALRARFNYTDGTTSDYASASFNPTTAQWQYSAAALVAEKPYSSILVAAVYDYCLNTVYFDGIQLFKEEFGSSYTYDEDGNLISVVDLQKKNTTYEYESNDLTAILEDNKAKMRYEYDAYHNVTKAITQKENEAGETVDGIVYEFAYDKWGNNTELKVTSGEITITTSATYTDDHNRMATSTDDLANVTTYCYNEDTNVLEWVQYPGDTETGRTTYTYDEMYRTATTAVNVPNLVGGSKLSVNYTFENDLLTKIKTPSTEYTFSYGAFAQRSSIKAGNHLLAEYKYSEDANRYLEKLTYGNGDFVEHDYDDKGRILSDTYSNGDTVTYTYDNDGNLASVTDSATGITTTYYYDLLGRQMKYAERSGQTELHSVEYGYNSENNLSAVTETVNGATHKTEYDYDSENRLTETDYGSRIEKITYDDFGRMSSTALEIEAEEPAEGEEAAENESVTQTTFQYQTEGNRTSSKLSAMTVAGSVDTLDSRYTYDAKGNITRYQLLDEDSETVEDIYYHYDTANQLVREDNFRTNTTTRWVYDTAGNIRYRKEYAYTTAVIENWDSLIAKKTVEYTYGDTSWGDLLTAYDGAPITYDAIGNPLSNGRWHYTWQNGRELASMERSDGSATWDYTYDVSGMRISRKNGSTVYNYVYTGSQLTQMTVGNDTLFFTYGVLGPTTVTWNGTTYYYALNAQGDITGIFDSAGNCVVTYQYQNAWGYNPAPTGTLASTLGTLNPLRYRGYVYDTESGLYYLQSRYYDPEICRFINADVYPSTGQGLTGNNMFSYCGNNPTSRKDDGGKFWNIVIGAAVGAVVSAVTTAIDTYTTTGSIDWGKVGISAAVGAVSGGVAATGLGTIAQAAISAGASAIGSVATDLYDRSKDPNAGKITWKEVGGIATRAIGSAAIGFGSSVFGTAAGKIVSGGIGAKGASMVFKGKIGAGCWTKAQARNMVSQGKVLINTARGLSSVVGTLFTWPTSTALSLGLSK